MQIEQLATYSAFLVLGSFIVAGLFKGSLWLNKFMVKPATGLFNIVAFVFGLLTIPAMGPLWAMHLFLIILGLGYPIIMLCYIGEKYDPKLERQNQYKDNLRSQAHDIQQRKVNVSTEAQASKVILDKLESLRSKMLGADKDLFADRIEVVSKAITLYTEERNQLTNLINEYDKILKILDIEYDTAVISEVLPGSETGKVLGVMNELKVVENKVKELKYQIEGTEEIRRLLKDKA